MTDLLTQHGLNLNTLVPVIEAWDETLTEYDVALTAKMELRGNRLQRLCDIRDRILRKQHANSKAIPMPRNIHRTSNLAERMARNVHRQEKINEGINTLQEQQDAVRSLLIA
jgi:hypothetical protein